MKNHRLNVLVCAFIALVLRIFIFPFLSFCPDLNMPRNTLDRSAVLPSSLVRIEKEAFADTVFTTMIVSDAVFYIGDRAFGGMDQLREIYLPESVKYIADSAFSQSGIKKIYGIKGTYAQEWAAAHGIEFSLSDIWHNTLSIVQETSEIFFVVFGMVCLPMDIVRRMKRYITNLEKSTRPEDRPELNPIDYRFP